MERNHLIHLVEAAQNGEQKAMNELFNAFYNDVYYFALKTVKDSETACDITQETFVTVITSLKDLKEPAAFVPWMKQVAYSQCTRYFRKKKEILVDEDEDGNTAFDIITEDRAEFIPDEALDQEDFRKTILGMLDELSEEQRAATLLYYYDELSVKQIAQIQGVSEGTVKSRLNYARKSIKASVAAYEKKNGVKLHCAGVLPLLLWLLAGTEDAAMPVGAAQATASGITAATGITVTAGTTSATTVAAEVAGLALAAKLAAIPLAAKIVACTVAGLLIAVGATLALQPDKPDAAPAAVIQTQPSPSQSTDWISTEPTVTIPGTTAPTVPLPTEHPTTDPGVTDPEEATPKKLTATVSGSGYQIGDTLEASDFTVEVTMSDGSVLTNPSGWTASTMKLTSTSNQLTITYQDLSTTVTVTAQPGAINGMAVVEETFAHIGLKYVDGGNSLTTGTDCSGFTQLIYAQFGVELPRTPSAQLTCGAAVAEENAKPGDLLVVDYEEGNQYDGHCGIYLGYGKMISAMPYEGVVISNVRSGMSYLRIFDNSYAGAEDEAYFQGLELLISNFQTGEFRGADISWTGGTVRFEGTAPNGNRKNGYLRLKLYDCEEGYEDLLEAWKKVYLARQYCIQGMNPAGDAISDNDYGYLNGNWYTYTQLEEMREAGQINMAIFWACQSFYGAFWNSNATIKTGLGETVDLSACPGLTNYYAIAKPGDPNEGKDNLPPYNPDGSWTCAKGHKWTYENNHNELECWYCGKTVTDSDEVKDHQHEIEVTYFNGGVSEDSYVEENCLTCGYTRQYLIQYGCADHDHNYEYNVMVFEPTAIMDGYTLHECICGASYRDQIVAWDGSD